MIGRKTVETNIKLGGKVPLKTRIESILLDRATFQVRVRRQQRESAHTMVNKISTLEAVAFLDRVLFSGKLACKNCERTRLAKESTH